jgi:Bacterial toxin of type II toxin-antitoxin system, YafQ
VKHRDHPLAGQWKGFRECHIEPDWLLISGKRPVNPVFKQVRERGIRFRAPSWRGYHIRSGLTRAGSAGIHVGRNRSDVPWEAR